MRKLATAALSFSAAVFLANYVFPGGLLVPAALFFAAGGTGLALLRRKWLRPAVIALLFFAVGLMEFFAYNRATIVRAAELAGQTREISGTVLDYPDVYDSYCRLRIRMESDDLPHFNAIVYDNDKALTAAEPGQKVRFTAKISPADTIYGKPYDNYHINGFYCKLNIRDNAVLEKGRQSIGTIPVRIRCALCQRIERVFPESLVPFLKALMLGDKQDFYQDDALYVSMTRAGLMHIVAVSGLHIAFLVGLLSFLLGNGRKSALFSIALIWLFVLVTGSSKSALRAAVMQTILLMAPILRRENDPITSLSTALALILAACPLAAKSVSLQLSFSAMAGIILLFERIYCVLAVRLPKGRLRKPSAYLCAVASSSLSVMIFTFPLTALHFSYVPLLSILSNLACLWAVSLCFCTAWIACAIAAVPLLGPACALLCSLLARYIIFCAGMVSQLTFSVLYMKTDGAFVWMLLCYGLIVLGLLLRRRQTLCWLLPVALGLCSLLAILWHSDRLYRTNDTVTVLNVGQGQCITAFAGDVTAVIDCGNVSTIENAGALAGEYLRSCGRDSIEMLMLTHLHEDHADGVIRLMEMLPVDTLILPEDAEGELLESIVACADRHGTCVIKLSRSGRFRSGRMELNVHKLSDIGKENERCLVAQLFIDDTELLVTGDIPKKLERTLVETTDLSGTDILVVGHHGSRYASSDELLHEVGGGLAVISVGYNNNGLPAEETLEALKKYGYNVMRTDRDGTIEILVGKNNG